MEILRNPWSSGIVRGFQGRCDLVVFKSNLELFCRAYIFVAWTIVSKTDSLQKREKKASGVNSVSARSLTLALCSGAVCSNGMKDSGSTVVTGFGLPLIFCFFACTFPETSKSGFPECFQDILILGNRQRYWFLMMILNLIADFRLSWKITLT